ncbi:ArsR family transcriptional regulator [Pseudomonas nicosulfuronedens]|uniref:VpaChn25_0724 family phage protein n=1 Tax=Pseudomonas nicosulfuronedens TaxID=2571105 RepID=UPI0024499911|nr:ArsR family transcriptional regulator [Pseudomonas nicosulfuronedens]MDH1007411.1 ArsR family transcriptional regulator [Pseudomonas nicosulfuronedens]MDH1977457.1 ArsR family transcriptional regulator [Pseudomonas nicosulfuronedens]MDH2029017.1 ArsR family transcriptional regulator [Pseudomonas nicosulfuronedens]
MSTPYADFLRQDMRLVILRLLVEMPAYRANSSVLNAALDSFGHAVSRDQVKTELAWLAEQGAISLEDIGPVVVATLTERGHDIAAGRARVPGIKRPGA